LVADVCCSSRHKSYGPPNKTTLLLGIGTLETLRVFDYTRIGNSSEEPLESLANSAPKGNFGRLLGEPLGNRPFRHLLVLIRQNEISWDLPNALL